jgi:hypothetical protein
VLYGGGELPNQQVVTLDPATGVATPGALYTGATGHLYALAPTPIPGSIPETSTWAMMLLGFASLGFAGNRASAKAREPGPRLC